MSIKVDPSIGIRESKYPEVREKLKSFCHKICFYQFVKRHPDRENFLRDVNSITMDKIYHLHKKIMTFDGDLSLFKDPELHLIAVAAYKRKIFDKHLTTTILHFKSVCDDLRIDKSTLKIHCLFNTNNGMEVNSISEKILRKGDTRDIKKLGERPPDAIQINKPKLLNEFWDRFLIEVRKRPRFEWYFLTCEDYDSLTVSQFLEKKSLTKQIQKIGFNEFNRFRHRKTYVGCIIASVGMMQSLVIASYGLDAPRLDPVIGVCSNSDIEWDGLHDTRKFGIQIPGASQPKKADGNYESEGWEYGYHDGVYHLNMAGLVPSIYRKKIIRLSQFLRKKGIAKTSDGENLCTDLSDIEHPLFRSKKNPGYKFLITVIDLIERIMLEPYGDNFTLSEEVLACIDALSQFLLQDKINASKTLHIIKEFIDDHQSYLLHIIRYRMIATKLKMKVEKELKLFHQDVINLILSNIRKFEIK